MKGKLIGRGRTALVYAWGENQVLKLYEPGTSVEKVKFEAELGQKIHAAGIASPEVEGFVEVEGQPGVVFERVSGQTMLEYVSKKPWRIAGAARRFAEIQAEMHSREVAGLPTLSRKIEWRLERLPQLSPETKAELLTLLAGYPAEKEICHGDFHPDNILMSQRGPVVIDWLDAVAGHRLYDVTRTSYMLTKAVIPPGTALFQRLFITIFRRTFHLLYMRRYRQLLPFSKTDFTAWTRLMAAARLEEGITEEVPQLLAMVGRKP